jgi:hypothetical protein
MPFKWWIPTLRDMVGLKWAAKCIGDGIKRVEANENTITSSPKKMLWVKENSTKKDILLHRMI